MDEIVTTALPALLGLVSFWLAWLLQARRNAQMTLAAVRGPQRAAIEGGSSKTAKAISAVAIRARARRRPVERWLARVLRRAPAPRDAFAAIASNFARPALAL